MPEAFRISPADAKKRLDAGEAIMLDVVAPAAWDQLDVAVAGALRIAPDELSRRYRELPKEREIIAYCT
jgi:rhodanese-related sulfurtransferase